MSLLFFFAILTDQITNSRKLLERKPQNQSNEEDSPYRTEDSQDEDDGSSTISAATTVASGDIATLVSSFIDMLTQESGAAEMGGRMHQ